MRGRMLSAPEGDYVERAQAMCSILHMLVDEVHMVIALELPT
jgi:hypothetical protein